MAAAAPLASCRRHRQLTTAACRMLLQPRCRQHSGATKRASTSLRCGTLQSQPQNQLQSQPPHELGVLLWVLCEPAAGAWQPLCVVNYLFETVYCCATEADGPKLARAADWSFAAGSSVLARVAKFFVYV